MLLNCCLEKTLESPLDSKIKTVSPKGNQPWMICGRTDAETSSNTLATEMNWLNRKGPDAGKYWKEEEKRMTEDEMVGWHHLINRHEFKQASGDGEGQGSWSAAVHGVAKSQTQLSDWTKTTIQEEMRFKKAKLLSWCHVLPNWWHHDLSLIWPWCFFISLNLLLFMSQFKKKKKHTSLGSHLWQARDSSQAVLGWTYLPGVILFVLTSAASSDLVLWITVIQAEGVFI